MNALVYVYIDQGIHYGKNKVERNEKWKMEKATLGFRIYKIWQILKHLVGSFHKDLISEE